MVCELYHNEKKEKLDIKMDSEIPLLCVPEVFHFKMLVSMPSNVDSTEAAMAATDTFFKSPAQLCP